MQQVNDFIASTIHKYPGRPTPLSPVYSPTSPEYDQTDMDKTATEYIEEFEDGALPWFAPDQCICCSQAFGGELGDERNAVSVCDTGHIVCKSCSSNFDMTTGKCPLYSCPNSTSRPFVLERLCSAVTDANSAMHAYKTLIGDLKVFNKTSEMKVISMGKTIVDLDDNNQRLEKHKHVLYEELCQEQYATSQANEKIDELMSKISKMEHERDQLAVTLGRVNCSLKGQLEEERASKRRRQY